MSLSRRAIFPSILLRRGTLFQLDSVSFPYRFSARSITIIGWHAPPDRGEALRRSASDVFEAYALEPVFYGLNAA